MCYYYLCFLEAEEECRWIFGKSKELSSCWPLKELKPLCGENEGKAKEVLCAMYKWSHDFSHLKDCFHKTVLQIINFDNFLFETPW